MKPISLFSLVVMKCINNHNTPPDFKHIMSVTESKEYIKHLVTVSKKKWKCNICDLIIDLGSKCNHLMSIVH